MSVSDPRTSAEAATLGHKLVCAEQFEAAEHWLGTALRAIEDSEGSNSLEAASAMIDLAEVYALIDNLDWALDLTRQAYVVRQEHLPHEDPELVDTLHTIGLLYDRNGDPGTALPILHNAYLARLASAGEHDRQVLDWRCDALHAAWRASADPVAAQFAREGLVDALTAMTENPGVFGEVLMFRIAVDYACMLWNLGDHERSGRGRDFAGLLLNRLDGLDQTFAAYLDDLAWLFEVGGDGQKMLEVRERSYRLNDRWLKLILVTLDDSTRRSYAYGLSLSTARFARDVLRAAPDDPRAARVALDFVLARKSIATEAAFANRPARRAHGREALAPLLDEIEQRQSAIDARFAEGASDGYEQFSQDVQQLRSHRREATSRLAAELGRIDPPRLDATREAVAASLPVGSSLVEFLALWEPSDDYLEAPFMADQEATRYVAFVVPAGRPDDVRLVDLGDGASVERTIYAYLVALDPEARDTIPARHAEIRRIPELEAGRSLRRMLFDPLLPYLGDRTRLLVSPDGAVARIPFGCLPEDQDEKTRLIDTYTISYLRTGRAVSEFARREPSQTTPPLILGDPDFDWADEPAEPEDADFYFPRLTGSAREATVVKDLIGGERVVDRDATQGKLMSCRSPAVLHLATHGFFLRRFAGRAPLTRSWRECGAEHRGEALAMAAADQPLLRSGLVLAGVNAWSAGRPLDEAVGDGILSAAEVARLDLAGTALVTLSACETALGDLTVGEGAAPLVQAFHVAGARTVLATLWQVPDDETLVAAFYTALAGGASRAEALRHAQCALKARALERGETDPWSWGAFVCYGDWAPLP